MKPTGMYLRSHIASANDLSYDYPVKIPPYLPSTTEIPKDPLLLHANKCLYKQAKAAISLQQ
jgi:hypothetical protein